MSHLSVTVRPAEHADFHAWLQMRCQLWPECPISEHLVEIDLLVGNEQAAVWIAQDNAGQLCGFLEAAIHPYEDVCRTRPVGYIEGLYVVPEARRRGISRQLLAAAEAWAASRGCSEMASDASSDNAASLAAHRASGFEAALTLVKLRKRIGPGAG